MVNDDDPVRGRMDVELDRVCAALEGPSKRGEGVLRELALRPAVADAFHGRVLVCWAMYICRRATDSVPSRDTLEVRRRDLTLTARAL